MKRRFRDRTRASALAALAVVMLLGVAGCGDDDSRPPPISQDPPESDLTWGGGNWDELNWQ